MCVCIYIRMYVYMYVCIYVYICSCKYIWMSVCLYVCMHVCCTYVCMYTSWFTSLFPYAACSRTAWLCITDRFLSDGTCVYHGLLSRTSVSQTVLKQNGAFTRAHLIQNKIKNCVLNGWLAIILAVIPVAVMQLAVIILAVMQLAVIKLAVMQLAVIELAVIGWNQRF